MRRHRHGHRVHADQEPAHQRHERGGPGPAPGHQGPVLSRARSHRPQDWQVTEDNSATRLLAGLAVVGRGTAADVLAKAGVDLAAVPGALPAAAAEA
ncbi:Clp protease N-terminal domain-containing protein [Actinomadura sp. NPDC047616]|uniref:Clp protease N-terminal domain-containing protein n=1 Tax=Actinomadura sp. NPDC047616 TaxID=3155914 RepID=UPI0033EBF6FE